jgi:hypothetical protein
VIVSGTSRMVFKNSWLSKFLVAARRSIYFTILFIYFLVCYLGGVCFSYLFTRAHILYVTNILTRNRLILFFKKYKTIIKNVYSYVISKQFGSDNKLDQTWLSNLRYLSMINMNNLTKTNKEDIYVL